MRTAVTVIVAVLIAIAGWFALRPDPASQTASANLPEGALVEVKVPELVGDAVVGKTVFDAKCSSCHGTNAAGRDGAGPPLVHKIYEPSHHGDGAFVNAAQNGVQSHHWRFGNMPPVEGVSAGEVKLVVAYIRQLQRANGIN